MLEPSVAISVPPGPGVSALTAFIAGSENVVLGLAAEELLPAELDAEDPHYPVLVTAACRKLAA